MTLSKLMTILGFLNVLVMGWLLVSRVVPAEPTNMTVFWVFLAVAILSGMAYSVSQTQVKGNAAAPEYRPAPIVETRGPAG